MIVARYIAEFLRNKGITHVFGYDGSMMLKIADEISLTDGIDFFQGFHEQASSFAADAYARVNHTLGVVLVTSGPGAINSLAGCADAFMDSIPLMIITGNDRLTHIESNPGVRLNGFQDLDIVSVARPITKYAVQLQRPEDVAYVFEKAYYMALHGRKGSVLVDVPMDVQFMEVPEELRHFEEPAEELVVSDDEISELCNMLYKSKRPVILAGGGAQIADASGLLTSLAQKTNIPVVTTLNGHDATGISLGASGFYGLPEANLAVKEADLLIALGVRFGERQAGKYLKHYTSAKLVHVEVDKNELGRVFIPDLEICADVKEVLEKLIKTLDYNCLSSFEQWFDTIYKWKKKYEHELKVNNDGMDPIKLVEYIGQKCPDDAIFTNDVGQNTMWVCQGLRPKGCQRLLTSSGYASMGFSLPAAIGAKMARPDCTVVSFSGDGGFHMNLQELQFVKLRNLNIKFIVFNNNTLGMMREVQRIYYNDNYVGSNTDEFTCVDLEKVADLYGLDFVSISSEEKFNELDGALNGDRAAIVECKLPIDTYVKNWNQFMAEHPDLFEGKN